MEPLILASSSLRRQDILRNLDIPFQVVIPDIEERYEAGMSPEEGTEFIAIKKVETAAKKLSKKQAVSWVLGADTLITLDGRTYGKPEDREQASEFLRAFSGKTQKIITAIALFNGKNSFLSTRLSINHLTFTKMTDEEIEDYLSTGEWQGVAGGYRIQNKGSCFISNIEGSYSAIVGLPIF
ncbi:MAG: Maf family protein, partial [Spirochaetaceae bacterium]|nr:Maf family protein [Spirochaetaceae bacterium]